MNQVIALGAIESSETTDDAPLSVLSLAYCTDAYFG